MKFVLTLFVTGVLLGQLTACTFIRDMIRDIEQVTFYPSYGYLEGDHWVIPMRIYVYEDRPNTGRVTARVMRSTGGRSREETLLFRSRIRDFAADSESLQLVRFTFDGDPENREYRLQNRRGRHPRTGLNGFKQGKIRVPAEKAETLLEKQDSQDGWLTIRAVSRGHRGGGRVRLIDPMGLSVISDIDDTVKITEIPAGSRIVIRNTFFREFRAAPGMAEIYSEWTDAAFHYVSGAPWQLYRSLSQFLFSGEAGFPEGTFHMKTARKNFLSPNTWRDLRHLITNENITYNQKIEQISTIKEHFPERRFILVGDSGEKDPEVYRTIRQRYPDQVREIIIRDVINDREHNPERLEGMTVIPAPTVTRPGSQPPGDPLQIE